jgi:hypothetical protein
MIETSTAAVVRTVYEAWAAQDVAKIDALMAPGFVMHVSGHHPLSGDRATRDAIWPTWARSRRSAAARAAGKSTRSQRTSTAMGSRCSRARSGTSPVKPSMFGMSRVTKSPSSGTPLSTPTPRTRSGQPRSSVSHRCLASKPWEVIAARWRSPDRPSGHARRAAAGYPWSGVPR